MSNTRGKEHSCGDGLTRVNRSSEVASKAPVTDKKQVNGVSIVTAGTDIAVTAISPPAVAPLPPTVLDRALPEKACTDQVPARNVRAPGESSHLLHSQ